MPTKPPEGSAGVDDNATLWNSKQLTCPFAIGYGWKHFRKLEEVEQVWDSFEIASRLYEQENKYRVATFIQTLEVYNGLPFENEEDKHIMSTVMELMERPNKRHL